MNGHYGSLSRRWDGAFGSRLFGRRGGADVDGVLLLESGVVGEKAVEMGGRVGGRYLTCFDKSNFKSIVADRIMLTMPIKHKLFLAPLDEFEKTII